ncbi:MAG: hypothetical protein KBD15_03985 [Candidatus Magasanikbacteria bacterium]|jgi:branched-subunit amino acid transport protein AzlD|nr:hypothetical protein [Candidatus Magasanikbacteria bacterium]
MKYIAVAALAVVGFGGLLFAQPQVVSAQGAQQPVVVDQLGLSYGEATGLGKADVRTTVGSIINIALGLLGTIALVLVVYAGFLWMTAAGNDDQVGTAKKILGSSIIGLIVILSAYSITRFVVQKGFEATTGQEYVDAPVAQ